MAAFWAAVKLQPNRERLALSELARNGYETYAPRILKRRFSHGRKITSTPLLFSNYVFIIIALQWHKARRSPGVQSLIMDGDRPARVPDAVIDELRGRERSGLIVLPKKPPPLIGFQKGDRLRVRTGIMRGCFGLYEGQAPHERIIVLMTLLGGERPVQLAAGDVVRV